MGTNSPVSGIEANLLAAILRCATIHHPVYCVEGLVLANSPINGTPEQTALIQWKLNHLKNGIYENSLGTLGWRYWQNF
jgi:hypothetical protein